MRTILIATVAAILAAAITATAANQGEPVRDKAAIKQLKDLNGKLGTSPYTRGLRSEIRQGFDDLYRVTAESCRTLAERSRECPSPVR